MKVPVATFFTGFLLLAGAAIAEDQPAAQSTPVAPKTDTAPITAAGFALDDVGFFVVDLKDGRVVAEHNADRPFIPASVAKIATIAAALTILGGDHTFTTTLLADGAVKDGVLSGSLILKGGGDPFLTGDDLQAMAKDLAAAGIKRVDGTFLYDATSAIEVPQINAMQPEAAGYNTGVSALSVNFNRVRVNWQRSAKAASAIAAAVSEHVTQPVDAIGLAFAEEDAAGPYVRAGIASEDRWLLSPDLAAKGQDWLPVGNPSLVTAEVFRALAAAQGVDLPAPTPGPAPEGARQVTQHDSIPLTNIARAVLRYSNNLSAELIGLAASRALTGRSLSLADSASALAAWWKLRLADADWSGMVLANHSGLSSDSRTTPRQIVTMLEEAATSAGGADFHELLKHIGWKGVKGSARVKTGTMSYARGLAGYIDTAAGNRLAFAIFFNDMGKRAALDAAFDPRVKEIDPASRPWRTRALKLEEKYTTGWAEQF
ncbi:MAG: D-alanyl-D-alanine carboxypeptidase/D-alanyl-D-alanine-endopeptidase [Bauldia sp.]|uniref:D-alanyl-D-alanine carboxypeptidase/D-alanyl-D-alanine endopeptidase n=1 Tax=Bauldia sp. TaxID=2575872 RepID=UPI001D73E34A|nr:D-alanyl-D-alanine carboxypeptidase/D-alanyl-D-alanine-endopeptidase [Bauldia sp.]MCB1494638.1 D-alanyl-D-alanine carboxypeptidase/D-alanyl-D-alanine-endopeptidase [Bauldia sp.]